jgi:hypothetical protein
LARERLDAELEAAGMVDMRQVEMDALLAKVSPLGLRIKDVAADGHWFVFFHGVFIGTNRVRVCTMPYLIKLMGLGRLKSCGNLLLHTLKPILMIFCHLWSRTMEI